VSPSQDGQEGFSYSNCLLNLLPTEKTEVANIFKSSILTCYNYAYDRRRKHTSYSCSTKMTQSNCLVVHPSTAGPSQEEAETPKQIRGGIMHEGGAGHPSMSYFSHFSTFPTVREIEMTFPSTLLFLSVLMLITRCKNSISLSLPLILPT